MSETGVVKGFKVFNPDWTCSPNGNTKQYTCPGKFEEDITPIRCGRGMHFCKKAADCFNYYNFNPENKVAEVVAYGDIAEEGDKCCTNKLEIVREIPWAELLEIVNMGKGCTGLCNSGNRNSGDWNKCSFSNGCFNTTSPKIYLFNKPSEWTYEDWLNSEARYLLSQIPGDVLEYIWLSDMTDEEKAEHPEAETTGGYLKVLDNSECAVIWWRGLSDRQKAIITAIPNFDKAIFKEITGIDVDED
mgnify:CR=1 FL=1